MTQFKITDWASNVLQYDGWFNHSSYGRVQGVPMTFKTFDDAWDYIIDKFHTEDHQDLEVEEIQ